MRVMKSWGIKPSEWLELEEWERREMLAHEGTRENRIEMLLDSMKDKAKGQIKEGCATAFFNLTLEVL